MPQGETILVVEDEVDTAELLRFNLEREGYTCRWAGDGQAALTEILNQLPDLIVLDRMLPRLSGDEVMRHLRQKPRTAAIPVILLTAKSGESNEVAGLSLGADDYIVKPFSMKLLLARVGAVLRRKQGSPPRREVMTSGDICLDIGRHQVTVNGQEVSATATELRILRALMAAEGRVLNRSQLMDAALVSDAPVFDRTIDVHVASLRKKLGSAGAWIRTIRGMGYAFRQPLNPADGDE